MTAISTEHAADALATCIRAKLPALLQGAPGIGKTALIRAACERAGMDCVILHPAMLDPTDIGGLPIPRDGMVVRMLDDRLLALTTVTTPTVLFLDEIGQAPPAVQAALAPILLDRTIGGIPLSPHLYVCAATNRREDLAGAHSILSHLVSRLCVLDVEVSLGGWTRWAATVDDMEASVVAFLRHRPNLLHVWTPDSWKHDAYPCPRSWHHASRLLQAKPSSELQMALLAGVVGEGAATECLAYLRLTAVIDIDEAVANPTSVKFPKELPLRYALATGVAYHATKQTAEAVLTIADRLLKVAPEFAALLVRDAFGKYPGLSSHPAWLNRAHSPLSAAIRGA